MNASLDGPNSSASSRLSWAASVAVFLLTFALYWPTLHDEFVWDDLQVTVDPYIHDSSHWAEVLSFRVLGRDVLDNNRPAMLASLMANAALCGMRPFGYHLVNNLLHAANAALLCLIACRVLSRKNHVPSPAPPDWWNIAAASIGALLFAAHPYVTEGVAVVTFREDPQTTFLTLAALWTALHLDFTASTPDRWSIILATWLLVLLAIATKENGVAAPALLLAYAIACRLPTGDSLPANFSKPRRLNRAWLALSLGSLVIVASFLAARFLSQPWPSDVFLTKPARPAPNLLAMLPVQSRIFAFNLQNIFYPTALSACYTSHSYAHISSLAGVLAVLAAIAACLALAWHSRLALLGVVIVGAGSATVSNIVPIINPIADRYLYLPMAGAAWLVAGAVALAGVAPCRRRLCLGVASILLVCLSSQSLTRQRVFHDERSLWTDAARKTPDGEPPFDFLGWVDYKEGRYNEALIAFGQAVSNVRGNDPDALGGAALALWAVGRSQDAEIAYRQAVALLPRFRNPCLIQRAFFWRNTDLECLAIIGRRAGLWIECQPNSKSD